MPVFQILLIIFGSLLLVASAIILIVAVRLYRFAIKRRKQPSLSGDELLYEQMMRKNKKANYYPLVTAGIEWVRAHKKGAEDVRIRSYDGLSLRGALFLPEKPRGAILLCHGFHSSGESDFGPVMRFYFDKGFALMLIDQRANGKSEGKHQCFGVKERYDVRSWMQYLARRYPDLPLFVSGVSMGCSSALYAVQLPDLPENLRGVIADCGYDVPYEEVAWFVKKKFKLVPWLFLPAANLLCRVFARFSLKDCAVTKGVDRISVPVLYLHGTKDTVVPPENAFKICGALKDRARLVITEEALHGCSYLEDPERWETEVGAFIKNCENAAKESA